MNYIYDILLDFNDVLYDFFDWNEDDRITHIRKIPLFKVQGDIYEKIKNHKITINKDFKEQIKNKTEIFENHKVKTIEYACLICNGLEVFALLFDEDGTSYKYSNLLLDENDEVIEVAERIDESIIKFKTICKYNNYLYLTRKDIDIIKYVNLEIKELENNKYIDKIKFLYYELFDEKNDDIQFILSEIKNKINNPKNKFYLKVYNFFKLASLKK